ncbi:MAG TPA: membrane protein insertase YidC [Melioribacteraceae bacterium]|nr:membrane protein insertase YidC [Melioribacteraceae bacterium]
MDKQTTLAFVLIGLILITWLYFNSPEPPKEGPKGKDTTLVSKSKQDSSNKSTNLVPKEEKLNDTSINIGPFAESKTKGRIITIETDLVKMMLNTKGGRILKYYLKDYQTWYYKDKAENDFFNRHVQLINPKKGGDLNLLFVTKDGQKVNTANLEFTTNLSNSYYKITGKDSLPVIFTYKTEDGKTIDKSFVFYANNYESALAVKFVNMQNTISGMRYDLSWDEGINFVEANSVDESTYSSASAYMGEEQEIIDASQPGDKVQKEMNGKIDWVGVRNKYFTMILSPKKSDSEWGAVFEGYHKTIGKGQKEIYSASLKVPFKGAAEQVDKFSLFLGPCDYDLLKSYDNNYQAIYDFGSFFGLKFITRPISEYILLPVFQFLHLFIPNYGFVIIFFSLLIKIALYPLSKQSMASMKKMQLLQPKIAEIKEKHKDDQQKVQTETMKLYQTYGINPAGGCLPMLLQMPILFALFTFFNVAIELRNEPFIFWITNLSSPDVIFTLPFKVPLFGVSSVSGLALLLGITMFLQQKQTVKDPSQAAMIYIMPVMFTLMFMNFSSGLNLYYFMFNLFSIAQQEIYNRRKGNVELVPVKPGQKKGFFARMMEAAEKQAHAQKEANKNRKK